MNPKVTFIVPCYQLAHFLPECIDSILFQTYQDFEILILDDCSLDNTADIASSYRNSKVKYVRNEANLGHLRNYNKGIGLARGKYIWLISADDCIRRSYALERYVNLMEQRPNVGYVFCPAVGLVDGKETGLLGYSSVGTNDVVFRGRDFLLSKLLGTGCIVAPTAMARKECYERISLFPLDMPHQGDIYLWSLFALKYDVGYFSDPMVSYRRHDAGMEATLKRKDPRILFADNLAVLWRIKREAENGGWGAVGSKCSDRLANFYRHRVEAKSFDPSIFGITLEEFESSIKSNARSSEETRKVRAKVYAGLGDTYYRHNQFERSLHFYKQALSQSKWMPKIFAKYWLLRSGALGAYLRDNVFAYRHRIAGRKSNP